MTWLADNAEKLAPLRARFTEPDTLKPWERMSWEHAMRDGGNDEDFAFWLVLADVKCQRLTGLSIHDLEDWMWRDSYDAGTSPLVALRDCLQDLGYLND